MRDATSLLARVETPSTQSLGALAIAPGMDGRGDAEYAQGVGAIVLAGSYTWGSGTFERLLRGPLLPVAQQPLISYPLRWLREGGVRTAAICAGAATRAVRQYFDDGGDCGLALEYYEDVQPRGPAGCARDAALAGRGQRFVIVEGALIPALDLRALLQTHRRSGAAATMVVEVDRRRAALGGERPPMPGGIYVIERRVLEAVPAVGFHDIKQGLLEQLYAAGEKVAVHEVQGVSPRILDFPTYASVSNWLVTTAARRQDQLEGWQPVGEAFVHPTAEIDPTARLFGPMLIGPGARIGRDAVLVGPVSVGADTHVGDGAVVSRAVLWEGCVVGAGTIVDSALLSDGAIVDGRHRVTGVVTADPGPGRQTTDPAVDDAPPADATGADDGPTDRLLLSPSLSTRRS